MQNKAPANQQITFKPIGIVRNEYPYGQKPLTWQGISSRIEIYPHWASALDGLSEFSHISVLCYLHGVFGETPVIKIRSQRNPDMPQVGLFATRTPLRPNPISLTVVQLIVRQENILHVRNLDMFDGTPVLDIKPYLTRGDCHPEATGPEWIYRLWAIHDAQRAGHQDAP
jgi:tRNA-Thr(GGU) m(6)t(6)A37 methyltransferase TsaA